MSLTATLVDVDLVLAGALYVDFPLAVVFRVSPISDCVLMRLWFISQILTKYLSVVSHQRKTTVAGAHDLWQAAEIV